MLDPGTLKSIGATDEEFFDVAREISPKFKWRTGHPVEIMIALDRTFGKDWPEWDEGTIIKHAAGAFGEILDNIKQKIWALQTVIVSDKPWEDFDVFEKVCVVFNGQVPLWTTYQPLDLNEIAFGRGCIDAIKQNDYDEEVLRYMSATLNSNGVVGLPKDIKFSDANEYIELNDFSRSLKTQAIGAWDAGVRANIDDNYEDTDAVEVQLYKFELLDDWYKLGRDYTPDVR